MGGAGPGESLAMHSEGGEGPGENGHVPGAEGAEDVRLDGAPGEGSPGNVPRWTNGCKARKQKHTQDHPSFSLRSPFSDFPTTPDPNDLSV